MAYSKVIQSKYCIIYTSTGQSYPNLKTSLRRKRMFGRSIKTILAAGILATGMAVSATGATHAASDFNIYVGSGYGDNSHFGSGHAGFHSKKGFKKSKFRFKRKCGPRRALKKAYSIGLKKPHIKRIGHQKISVVGHNRGHLAKVVFLRTKHGCKVIKKDRF